MDAMQLQPKPADYPRIRKALKVYKVTSVITGVMLLMLCVVMVMKYAFSVQLYLFGDSGFATFEPIAAEGIEADYEPSGFNVFRAILVAHGWFYVVYLISDFMLWSPMRWGFSRFLLIASGGVVPLMSFILEGRIVREVSTFLDEREAALASAEASGSTGSPKPPSSSQPPASSSAHSTEGRS
jgi:integral membrane protein